MRTITFPTPTHHIHKTNFSQICLHHMYVLAFNLPIRQRCTKICKHPCAALLPQVPTYENHQRVKTSSITLGNQSSELQPPSLERIRSRKARNVEPGHRENTLPHLSRHHTLHEDVVHGINLLKTCETAGCSILKTMSNPPTSNESAGKPTT